MDRKNLKKKTESEEILAENRGEDTLFSAQGESSETYLLCQRAYAV